jgi:hypothetical protein
VKILASEKLMMRTTLQNVLVKLAAAVLLVSAIPVASAQQGEAPLTNGAVVKLVRAGFKEKTVIAIIHSRASRFNLEPDKLIELKRNGVSENISLAMLGQSESFSIADDEWMDDSGLRGTSGNSRKQPGGTDIFGSSSGSKSQSGGRGLSNGNDGDTTTTGSVTARILRPPTEAGEAMKLEKTPTLTNESVIKLVEAGFSEGTIIKRIEDSPVNFELSTAKIEELRRRRVTEPIIRAMTQAMGDDSGSSQGSPNVTPAKSKGN